MKIAIVSDTIFPHQVNGVAKTAQRSAESLMKRGHEVEIVSVASVPTLPFWGYQGERLALPCGAAYRQIARFKPDVIHVHTPFTLGWEAILSGKRIGASLIGTHHTFFDHYLKHVHLDSGVARKLSWKYLALHYNRYDMVLSPSEALIREMREHGLTAEANVFPNAVDTEFFSPDPSVRKERSLVYMGRVSYEKSIHRILEALSLVQAKCPDCTLTIVGDGPERQRLERLAREMGLQDRVLFTGMLRGADLVKSLRSHKIFVTASKSENMPLSVMEALASGLPVVGVDSLGIPEIVRDGIEGLIAPPDDAQALADRIQRLLKNEEECEALAQAARFRALTFGEEENAEKLEAVYNALITSRHGR